MRSRSRGALSPGLCTFIVPLSDRGRREGRAPTAPAAPCAMGSKERTRPLTGTAETSRPSPRNGLTAYTCSCVRKICQNVRTGGSDQPPVAGSEPEVLEGHKSLSGSVGQVLCLPQTVQLQGHRAGTEQ